MDRKVKVIKSFLYDEDLVITKGVYNWKETGVNGYPMIEVNGEWLDIAFDEPEEMEEYIKYI